MIVLMIVLMIVVHSLTTNKIKEAETMFMFM